MLQKTVEATGALIGKTFANLCKPIYDIINYSTSNCPFESGQCGKEGKKLQIFEYLENEKSL